MINSTSRRAKKQVLPAPFPVFGNVEWLMGQLTEAELVILNVMYQWASKCRLVFPSLDTIAQQSGYSVKTVQRANIKFRELGLCDWLRRRYTSNLYFLSEFFRDRSVRNVLKRFMPALRIFSLSLLMCVMVPRYYTLKRDEIGRLEGITCAMSNNKDFIENKEIFSSLKGNKEGEMESEFLKTSFPNMAKRQKQEFKSKESHKGVLSHKKKSYSPMGGGEYSQRQLEEQQERERIRREKEVESRYRLTNEMEIARENSCTALEAAMKNPDMIKAAASFGWTIK